MSLPIVFLDEARTELQEAADWYESQRAGLGLTFVRAVFEAIDRISHAPQSFAVVRRGTRSAPVSGFPYYRVYYRESHDAIQIVAVFHGSRDPRHWRRRT